MCEDPHEYNFIEIALVEGPVIYEFTLHVRIYDPSTWWFWRCIGTAFGHFLLGSHNFMVTALGSCVALRIDLEVSECAAAPTRYSRIISEGGLHVGELLLGIHWLAIYHVRASSSQWVCVVVWKMEEIVWFIRKTFCIPNINWGVHRGMGEPWLSH
jgi:hypothetical protein